MKRGRTFSEYIRNYYKDKPEQEDAFYKELLSLSIGEEIKELRLSKGLTQREFADLIGSSQSAVARLENSGYNSYSLKTLLKISNYFEKELVISFRDRRYQEGTEPSTSETIINIDDYRPKPTSYEPEYIDANGNFLNKSGPSDKMAIG